MLTSGGWNSKSTCMFNRQQNKLAPSLQHNPHRQASPEPTASPPPAANQSLHCCRPLATQRPQQPRLLLRPPYAQDQLPNMKTRTVRQVWPCNTGLSRFSSPAHTPSIGTPPRHPTSTVVDARPMNSFHFLFLFYLPCRCVLP